MVFRLLAKLSSPVILCAEIHETVNCGLEGVLALIAKRKERNWYFRQDG